jgi:hypothetical protein
LLASRPMVRRLLLPVIVIAGFGTSSCVDDHGCEVTLSCSDDAGESRGGAGGDDDPSGSDGGSGDTPNPSLTPTGEGADSGVGGSGGILVDGGSAGASGGFPGDASMEGGGGLDGGASGGAGGDINVPIVVTRCSESETETCSGSQPVCDVELDRCVVCLLEDDSGCAAETPYCVGASNDAAECVECEGLDDCSGATPLCSEAGACVGCLTGEDCAVFEGTPLCREDGECVSCVSEDDCDAQSAVCGEDGQCTGCADSAECTRFETTPVCNTEAGTCVECVGNAECSESTAPRCDGNTCGGCQTADDCTGHPGLPQCDTETGACVACNVDADCGSTTASACLDNVCVPCTGDEQCGHLPGTTVCDVGAGECVQCTVANETPCGDNSCDPATRACTETERGSRDYCESCVADSECIGGDEADPTARCVPMEYAGEPRAGGYCLQRLGEGCARPYATLLSVSSLSGALPEEYCGILQDLTTCEAVLDLDGASTCPGGEDNECGCERDADGQCVSDPLGGVCGVVGGILNVCTYRCGSTIDCPNGRTCSGSDVCQ